MVASNQTPDNPPDLLMMVLAKLNEVSERIARIEARLDLIGKVVSVLTPIIIGTLATLIVTWLDGRR